MSSLCHIYRLADREIVFNRILSGLDHFYIRSYYQDDEIISFVNFSSATNIKIIQTEGWLLDHLSTVSLYRDENGYWIEIPHEGTFWVAFDGKAVFQVAHQAFKGCEDTPDVLLGAPLIFALALQGVWCLHAGAVMIDGKVIAFLGDTGAGKSTLVAYLKGNRDVFCASDDIMPVVFAQGALMALPHFPQLKLPLSAQPGYELPEKLPVLIIYVLEQQENIELKPYHHMYSVENLIRNTVGTRLFISDMLSEHLDFCSKAADNIIIKELSFPRKMDVLPTVMQRILEDFPQSSKRKTGPR